jgi:hypothetical protein
MEELLKERLIKKEYSCQLKTLSQVIKENAIAHIDLLKIDVENAELDVINGIAEGDWAKIDQIIIEVYDENDRLKKIKQMLSSNGFTVSFFQSDELKGTKFYDIYGARSKKIIEGKIAEPLTNNWFGTNALIESVRQVLMGKLPVYMVPSEIVLLDSMPLTANGKIDKKSLPVHSFTRPNDYVAPVTETEVALCTIWQEVLGREQVGIRDDFFRIGGNSINAIRVAHRISKHLGMEITIKDIFIYPTIASIIEMFQVRSRAVVTGKTLNSGSGTSYIEDNLYHTLPLQAYRYKEYKTGNIKSMAGMIMKELNDVDEKAFSKALDTMVSRHESLRTIFLDREGIVLQKVCSADTFVQTLLTDDITGEENKDEKIKEIVNDLSRHLFDFQKEPSFKCKLIKHSEGRYVLIFVIDHIINDAHSLGIIEYELYTIYNAYLKGLPNPLKPLNEQFKDFVNFYRTHYEGDKLTYHKKYYQHLFAELPETIRIRSNYIAPQGTPGSAALGYPEGGGYRFFVPEDILRKIHKMSAEMKISFFNFILAAYSIFLSKVTYQKEFIIDSPMSIRSKEDHSKIIGWLTGTLVTRIKVDENAGFNDLLNLCTSAYIDAIDHIYYQFSAGDELKFKWFEETTQLNILNDVNTATGIIKNFQPEHFDKENVSFNISFLIEAFKNGLMVTCSYKRNFIDKRSISAICGKFLEVLSTAVDTPNVKIKDWTKTVNS